MYPIISNITVLPATISKIVILLSLEKFLLKYPPKNPIKENIIADTPNCFPANISKQTPQINPTGIATFLPIKSPTHKTKTINKFGFTPAILNQLKKFTCRKYTIKNVIIITIIEITFFRKFTFFN